MSDRRGAGDVARLTEQLRVLEDRTARDAARLADRLRAIEEERDRYREALELAAAIIDAALGPPPGTPLATSPAHLRSGGRHP
jgi:hypothetical protein